MNENCKYCKTSKTCLENADYGSIYCQLHKRIPKVIGKTYDELLRENKKLQQKLQQRDNIINYCKFQIEKENDKFPFPLESQEWLKGRISAFEEILYIDKGE